MFVALLALVVSACPAIAQKQEKKLIDRLLRPNTALTNSEQDKKFVAATSVAALEKRAPARSLPAPEITLPKSSAGERTFTARQFAARHFRMGDTPANLATRTELTKHDKLFRTPPPLAFRVAAESTSTAPVHEFAGNRPFLGRGKSQKALQASNRPLTIDEVRELLNKSK